MASINSAPSVSPLASPAIIKTVLRSSIINK
jgi:hypothetical protein